MKRIGALLGVLLLLAGTAGVGLYVWRREVAPPPPPPPWTEDMQTVANGNNAFALDLYAQLAADEQNKGKNLFFSPYSVHIALAMTATGAKGNTRDQMVKTLRLPNDDAKVLASGDLGRFYAHPRADFELSVANALWGQKGFPWRPELLDAQEKRFGAGFREADFRANPDGERDRINKWVEEQTRDRIKELLLQGQVTERTKMVLANAIYFKGKWAEQFKPKNTRPQPFRCDAGTKVDVPMMYESLKAGYHRDDDVEMASLSYRGGELSMVVLLPGGKDNLAVLEKKLTPDKLAKWLAAPSGGEVQTYLPKFRIETRYGLSVCLKALGITDAFNKEGADFGGMTTEQPLFISDVVHKAFVEVNEEGTEAAAATAVVVNAPVSMPAPPKVFRADRPFLFLIRDVKHGTILFMGRVERP